ncbi:MAG: ATP-binding cassette domain-containing protein [Actinomycetota bacterium]|jgi:ABC-2 type transport system ATP-binding protein
MLELAGLTKRYGEVVALDGAGVVARPGRIVGFLGPNGAGKTTAMRSIFGLVSLDAGTVTWNGKRVDAAARLRFGYMPEQRGLYPKMRVGAQVSWLGRLRGLPRADATRSTAAWLQRLGLSDRAGDRVEALSHGNQQRAQLAASLVHEPDLLVLDEPFSGLDPMGVDAMSEVIRSRSAAGATVIFSSHQLDLVEDLCQDVAIIDRGQVVVSGTIDDVRSTSPSRRLEVGFADPSVRWEPPSARLIREREGVRTYMVPRDADPGAYLAAAASAGRVTSFTFQAPRLSEIFREAVGR